ncbi:RNA polymerase sigma factor, sigma-70 family [Catalinimonas alkaloidigena]|uniref:RNA polymerase sigma factor, sigma-70 family n=1 Tax=Catalinimonas alkaloidigena TaxID=1075417 RepID=A0A1G9TLX9_9BACT|nr:sigma-70 family RNA polymerase sigma factor [Catalinimonas alkaloidigena]SDM48747.1 RNA polymerase sigma factor, sigma-70 family [Catalinimonas alkaloidigena]
MKQDVQFPEQPSALWDQFRAGDPQALSVLFLEHYEALFNYGLKLTSEEALVEDGIQEVFGELWQSRGRLSAQVSSVRFYLLTSLRHRLVRHLQVLTRKTNPYVLAQHYEQDYSPSTEEQLLQETTAQQQSRLLRGSIDALPRRQREAMFLRYFEEMSYPEIAELMHCNVQSVRNLIHQALTRLRHDPALQRLISTLAVLLSAACAAWSGVLG